MLSTHVEVKITTTTAASKEQVNSAGNGFRSTRSEAPVQEPAVEPYKNQLLLLLQLRDTSKQARPDKKRDDFDREKMVKENNKEIRNSQNQVRNRK